MSGFYGQCLHRPAGAGLDASQAPAHELTWGGDAQIALQRGAGWAVGVADARRGADCWTEGQSFALVHGQPQLRDSEMARVSQERGLAAACAEQYRKAGAAFLTSLDGPFALAIRLADGRSLLAIDRAGVRSLYYDARPGGLVFATKLPPIARCKTLNLEIEPQSVFDFMYFHVIPGPATIFKSVRTLLPGTFLEHDGATMRVERYWDAQFEREHERVAVAPLETEFVALLKQSVRKQVEGGGAVGCFLSGGTDSSTVAGMLGAVTGAPARTYSIGFKEEGFDELGYARIAANHFRTRHNEYYVTPSDIVALSRRIPGFYGQPFGNSSIVPSYYCAQMAKADGIDRLLGGDGGDELFGGNSRYATQVLFSYYDQVPRPLRRVLESVLLGRSWVNKVPPARKVSRYIEQALVPMPDRLQTYNHFVTMGERAIFEDRLLDVVDVNAPNGYLRAEYARARADSMLNKMMASDLKFTLADNDLPKVVGACDAAKVDVTFPFLDDELIKFALRLPAHLKVSRLRLRWFFKRALRDFLPAEIIQKKKHGFGLPFGQWLVADQALRELAFDSLATLKRRSFVRPAFIDELRDQHLSQHAGYYGGLIWVLMMLELWLEWYEGGAGAE